MEVAADRLQLWREKPQVFVREALGVVPDPWQDQVLEVFPHKPRIAMKASKGVGKSSLEAWLAWNFLLTRPFPRMAAVSISGDNLRDGLWAEMSKWQGKSELLQKAFTIQKERIYANVDNGANKWFLSARQWSKSADPSSLGNTLAGIHEDYIMFILDESGGLPDAIMATAEAALSSCKEGHIVQAGNPTHLEGPLYRACTSDKDLWFVVEISSDPDNPNRSPRVSKQWAEEQIKAYGRDNPWVLVNVFGRFPPSSFNALIGPEELKEAVDRRYKGPEFENSARIMGVDVARFGSDSSVIFKRQGLQCFNPVQVRGYNGTEGAELALRNWVDFNADACFIDNTGGFGSSWIDNLIRLGRDPIPVEFNGKSSSEKYFNKRAEMVFTAVEWIKRGGCLPEVDELIKALAATTYTFKGDKLLIAPKEEIKEKLMFSPDHMDAFILTFAAPIEKQINQTIVTKSIHQNEYDPFSRDRVLPANGSSNKFEYIYDPRRLN